MENGEINNFNTQENSKKDFWKGFFSSVWEIVKIVIIAAIIVLPIRYFLFQPFIVKGESMMPNYQNGNYLIIDEISYRFMAPQRGDVIVFNTDFISGYRTDRFIKRIIGLPGETITVKDSKITVAKDNKVIEINEAKYLPGVITSGDISKTLGKDEYFVMGDNRQYSFDSRMWGVLPKKEIIGKVFLRLLPLNKINLAQSLSY